MKSSLLLFLLCFPFMFSQNSIENDFMGTEKKVIKWRRHFHQNPELATKMSPSLEKVARAANIQLMKAATGGKDFSYFQEVEPGIYFFLGGMASENTEAFTHHTPDFKINKSGMLLGVKAITQLTFDYLNI